MNIPFNKPYLTGNEIEYIFEAVYKNNHISGNGYFTKKCHEFFENRYKFKKTLLTTSCTDALEMCAILLDIKPGDEVIVPSYTFVSSALAFVRQGAKIVFADSRPDHPGIDENKIEELITSKTKVIVVVHYAGVAVDMDKIMAMANKYNLYVVEDAAQAIDSYFTGKDGIRKPLGSIGHLGTFSFHETKNIQCGEGGLLIINDERFIKRSEIIWEKGTNRAEFFRGEVNKYGWVDIGSSFLPSDLNAAFLYAQLEKIDDIQNRRKDIWQQYYKGLKPLEEKGLIKLPVIPDYATNNGHMFYIIFKNVNERTRVINYLKSKGILSVFHYVPLHSSLYYHKNAIGVKLNFCDYYADNLLRLPFFYNLSKKNINIVIKEIVNFFNKL